MIARGQAQGSIPAIIDTDHILALPSIDVPALRDEERSNLTTALDADDLKTIIEHYPIRETGALAAIANGLGFQSCSEYERAVLKLLIDDADSLAWARSLFDPLASDIASAGINSQ